MIFLKLPFFRTSKLDFLVIRDQQIRLKSNFLGIYIRKDELSLPKEYRGIGIRIEDDILVTNNEPIILSVKCPKEVDDVEKVSKTRR